MSSPSTNNTAESETSGSSKPNQTSQRPAASSDNQKHFEKEYYDEYDYYNLEDDNKLFKHASGKGRSKKEASIHSTKNQGQSQGDWSVYSKFEKEAENRKKHDSAERQRSTSK